MRGRFPPSGQLTVKLNRPTGQRLGQNRQDWPGEGTLLEETLRECCRRRQELRAHGYNVCGQGPLAHASWVSNTPSSILNQRKTRKQWEDLGHTSLEQGVTATACLVLIWLYATTFGGGCVYLSTRYLSLVPINVYGLVLGSLFFNGVCRVRDSHGKSFVPHREVCNTKNVERIRPEG